MVKKDLEDNPLFQPFCVAQIFRPPRPPTLPSTSCSPWSHSVDHLTSHRNQALSSKLGDKEVDVSSFSPRLHRCIPGKHSQVLFITNICSSENVLLCWVPHQCLGVYFAQIPETRNHTFATLQEGLCGSLPLLFFLQPVLWPLQFSLAISSCEQSALPQSVSHSSSFPSAFSWEQESGINSLLTTPPHLRGDVLPWSCPPAHLCHHLQSLGICCLLIMFRAFGVGKSRTMQRLVPGGIFTAG